MKQRRYSAEEKTWVLQQMSSPVNRAVVDVARETGITTVTLRTWLKESRQAESGVKAERKGRWSSADKFRAVLESAPMSEAERAEYCRSRAIEPEQLRQWRHACERANDASESVPALSVNAVKQIKELQRELRRKEAALAEAAALLVLRKKADAIWGKDEAE